jgi:hypothetical protein
MQPGVSGERFSPWQFLAEVDELPIGTVLIDQSEIHTGFRAIGDFHLCMLRT